MAFGHPVTPPVGPKIIRGEGGKQGKEDTPEKGEGRRKMLEEGPPYLKGERGGRRIECDLNTY